EDHASIVNQATGLYDIQTDGTVLEDFGGQQGISNSGTIRKSAGGGTTSVHIGFSNQNSNAVVDVTSGTLQFNNGGTSQGGRFTVSNNAVLDLTGGSTLTYTGSYTGSGNGTVRLSGGTLDTGTNGATFNFPSAVFQWTGGIISGGGLTN